MSVAIAVIGAAGLTLVFMGLPWQRTPTLKLRVDPYVSGLTGRPSSLLRRSSVMTGRSRARRVVARLWRSHETVELPSRLEAAGRAPDTIGFRVEQVTWGVAGGVCAMGSITLGIAVGMTPDPRGSTLLTVIGFAVGFGARDWWLTREAAARSARRDEELPIALDLVSLSVMAGESVPAAFERVGAAIGGVIGGEFHRVIADVRAGASLLEGLEAMSRRSAHPSIGRFVDALCTGLERGTPLAEVLRAQADDARELKRRRLLELGGRKEVLMLVPVVFLIMPVVVVFALYPGLVSLQLLVP